MSNSLILEEKITCGKIKSKAKTILVGKINGTYLCKNDNINTIKETDIINTIKFENIKIKFNNENTGFIKNELLNSTIIISTNSNPKESKSHILIFPGYLGEICNESCNEMKLNIYFNNFFPNNIPLNYENLYFMIWFKKIIPSGIILNSFINYDFDKLFLNENCITEQKFLYVQQLQTFNFKTMSFKKIVDNQNSLIAMKNFNFCHLSRGFWIRMNIFDYDNLIKLKITLNGLDRLILSKLQIELMGIKKNTQLNCVLIYLDLEFCNLEWKLPKDINQISQIFLNSLNCSRIDRIKFIFEFDSSHIKNDIQISSLSLNMLDIQTNNILYKYF